MFVSVNVGVYGRYMDTCTSSMKEIVGLTKSVIMQDLPENMHSNIIRNHMDASDALKLSTTCKSFYHLVCQNPVVIGCRLELDLDLNTETGENLDRVGMFGHRLMLLGVYETMTRCRELAMDFHLRFTWTGNLFNRHTPRQDEIDVNVQKCLERMFGGLKTFSKARFARIHLQCPHCSLNGQIVKRVLPPFGCIGLEKDGRLYLKELSIEAFTCDSSVVGALWTHVFGTGKLVCAGLLHFDFRCDDETSRQLQLLINAQQNNTESLILGVGKLGSLCLSNVSMGGLQMLELGSLEVKDLDDLSLFCASLSTRCSNLRSILCTFNFTGRIKEYAYYDGMGDAYEDEWRKAYYRMCEMWAQCVESLRYLEYVTLKCGVQMNSIEWGQVAFANFLTHVGVNVEFVECLLGSWTMAMSQNVSAVDARYWLGENGFEVLQSIFCHCDIHRCIVIGEETGHLLLSTTERNGIFENSPRFIRHGETGLGLIVMSKTLVELTMPMGVVGRQNEVILANILNYEQLPRRVVLYLRVDGNDTKLFVDLSACLSLWYHEYFSPTVSWFGVNDTPFVLELCCAPLVVHESGSPLTDCDVVVLLDLLELIKSTGVLLKVHTRGLRVLREDQKLKIEQICPLIQDM